MKTKLFLPLSMIIIFFSLAAKGQTDREKLIAYYAELNKKIENAINKAHMLPNSTDHLLPITLPESKNASCDFVTIKKFIPLETTPDFLIGNICRIENYKNKYYILDKGSTSVYIYSKKGKFLKQMHNIGRGKSQFVNIYSIYIDQKSKQLVLYCNQIHKYLFYDLDGNFISEELTHIWFKDFSLFKPGLYCCYVNNNYNKGNLLFMNRKGILGKGITGSYNTTKGLGFYNYRPFIKDFDESKLLMPTLFDTLYQFNLKSSFAKYVIDYAGRGVPKEYLEMPYQEFVDKVNTEDFYYCRGEYFETNNFVGFNIGNQNKFNSLIYSKKNKQTYFGKLTDKNTGIEILFPGYSFTSQLVSFQLPETILEYYHANKDKEFPNDFIKLCENLKKYDNPVILELEFEEFKP
jgi:hypothetical protein